MAAADFYRLCDELGVMVMCDFPLIWTYAFELPSDEDAAFRESVRTQVEDMVRLLSSHPGIILWSIHNEPPWTPDGSFLGSDVHQSATNQQMDEDSAARARALDSTQRGPSSLHRAFTTNICIMAGTRAAGATMANCIHRSRPSSACRRCPISIRHSGRR